MAKRSPPKGYRKTQPPQIGKFPSSVDKINSQSHLEPDFKRIFPASSETHTLNHVLGQDRNIQAPDDGDGDAYGIGKHVGQFSDAGMRHPSLDEAVTLTGTRTRESTVLVPDVVTHINHDVFETTLPQYLSGYTLQLLKRPRPAKYLIDEALELTYVNRLYAPYRKDLTEARRFVLSDATAARIASLASDKPEKILSYVSMAHLPFEKIWLELDLHQLMIHQQESIGIPGLAEPVTPFRIGFLVRRDTRHEDVWSAITWSGSSQLSRSVMPDLAANSIDLRGEGRASSNIPVADPSQIVDDFYHRYQAAAFGWIFDMVRIPKAYDRYHRLAMEPYLNRATGPQAPFWSELYRSNLATSASNIRFLICALALINEVPITISERRRPKGSRAMGGQIRQYLDHAIIELNVDRVTTLARTKRILSTAISKKRRHEVRAHWRTFDTPLNERWQAFFDERRGQTRYRIRIAEHERGDASLGFVTHDYNVVTEDG